MLNVLDLFSGTGELGRAFHEALESQGVPCQTVAYCEREPYAQAILLSRMARREIDAAPICTDVLECSGADLPAIHAIVGGFPCQDISLAGKGVGLVDGERSGLFFEIVRLAGETGANLLYLENVPAITIRGGDTATAHLAALGYDLRWGIMGADDFGGTHKRQRWWCMAYAAVQRSRGNGGSLQHTDGGQEPRLLRESVGSDEGMAHSPRGGQRKRRGARRPGGSGEKQDMGHADPEGLQEPRSAGQRQPPTQDGQGLDHRLEQSKRGLGDTTNHGRGGGHEADPGERERQGCPCEQNHGQNIGDQPVRSGDLPSRPPLPDDIEAWARILATHPEVEPAIRGVVVGITFRNDRIRALGNGVDFPCAKTACKILLKGKES